MNDKRTQVQKLAGIDYHAKAILKLTKARRVMGAATTGIYGLESQDYRALIDADLILARLIAENANQLADLSFES